MQYPLHSESSEQLRATQAMPGEHAKFGGQSESDPQAFGAHA
jgi:hypothetical protein